MPAPTRPVPVRTEATALAVPKGIVGVYTDAEVDSLLAALQTGGGGPAPDLTAYATTAYVDGKLATVYTKAEVDAALANAAAGGTIDLSTYVTSVQLTEATDEIKEAAAAAFQERYTKTESDDLFMRKDDAVAPPDLDGYATEQYVDETVAKKADQVEFSQFQGYVGTLEADYAEKFRLLNQGFATVAQQPDVDAALELKADKAETYTKLEVDAAIAGIVTGDLSQEQVDAIISQVGPVDLTAYAKSEDVYAKTESDDRYAAKSDNTQQLLTKTIVAQGFGFGFSSVPTAALNYADSGEGYGERLILNTGAAKEFLVYKSDLDTLFPAIDTSQFTTTVTVAALDARINTLESTRATTTTTTSLDTRIKSLESKSAATSNINDATNAALKKSILDAVALMIAGGGNQPPADIDWTPCRVFGSNANHPIAQARMIGGVIELRGTLSFPSGATGDQSFCRLPVSFPFAEFTTSLPAAARVTTGSVAVAAFVTFSSQSANIGYDTASRVNEVFLTGIKVKAAY